MKYVWSQNEGLPGTQVFRGYDEIHQVSQGKLSLVKTGLTVKQKCGPSGVEFPPTRILTMWTYRNSGFTCV